MVRDRVESSAAAAVKRVSRFLAHLSEEDLADLASGRATIELVYKKRMPERRQGLVEIDIEQILKRLGEFEDRDAGIQFLEARVPTRADLVSVATALDLPSAKGDTILRIRQRIAEATIGYRLRSKAIHGQGDE